MKILIVCSKNSGKIAPFILEQGESLRQVGVEVDYYPIVGKGVFGYWKNRKELMQKIRSFRPNIIHAHYGLSGLLANTQRKIPVVTTYHGSDINLPKVYPLSRMCMMLSEHTIFVSKKNIDKAALKRNFTLLPCGVDTSFFLPTDKLEARQSLGLDATKKLVLFAGSFDNYVKNSTLAQAAVSILSDVQLLELKGYSRQQVLQLMNAVDLALMTSFSEGSPQFIKEAMACNCPIVSVPVGDVPFVIDNVDGCYIASYDAADLAEKIKMALVYGKRTEGRKRIIELELDVNTVAEKLVKVYQEVIGSKMS